MFHQTKTTQTPTRNPWYTIKIKSAGVFTIWFQSTMLLFWYHSLQYLNLTIFHFNGTEIGVITEQHVRSEYVHSRQTVGCVVVIFPQSVYLDTKCSQYGVYAANKERQRSIQSFKEIQTNVVNKIRQTNWHTDGKTLLHLGRGSLWL